MTAHDPGNRGSLQIEVFALSHDLFQWMVIDHEQQREGHLLVVAQGRDGSPFFAEAHAREARRAAIAKADKALDLELAAKARARRRAKERITGAP